MNKRLKKKMRRKQQPCYIIQTKHRGRTKNKKVHITIQACNPYISRNKRVYPENLVRDAIAKYKPTMEFATRDQTCMHPRWSFRAADSMTTHVTAAFKLG